MTTVSPHGVPGTGADRSQSERVEPRPIPASPRCEDGTAETVELRIGAATDIEIDLTADPPRVVAKSGPRPEIFAGAVRFRPVVAAFVVATAIVVACGVVVFASVLLDGVSPRTSPFGGALPERSIVASRGSSAEPGRCTEMSGRVFVDGDGNAIADAWDPEHDHRGVEVLVETDSGGSRRVPVDADGAWSLVFDAPTAATVRVLDVASLLESGLWPGPRSLDEAGEAPIVGETCTLDLGMVWKPDGATAPWVGAVGAMAAQDRPVADPTAEASGWRAGIQVHGRVWSDADGDGRFGPAERGVANATIALQREDGSTAAVARTGTDGTYALSNLRPTSTYTVTVTVDGVVTVVRAMGERIATLEPSRVEIGTSATGMSVWGLDFGVDRLGGALS